MIMTERVSPNVSFSGVAVALSLVVAGWLATPAQSSEPEERSVVAGGGAPMKVSTDVTVYNGTRPSAGNSALGVAPPPPRPYAAATGGGRRGARGSSSQRNLENRLERLEQQLNRLSEQIERLAEANEKHQGAYPLAAQNFVRKNPESHRQHIARDLLGRGIAQRQVGPISIRTYHLPQGKLRDLTELMVRNDVPTRVRPVEDGIEVHGTAAEHVAFRAFIDTIRGNNKSKVVEYHLPQGKLKALTKLMIRNDVPIIVSPHKETIEVHGGPAVQAVFKAFLNLLHPPKSRKAEGQAQADAAASQEALARAEYLRLLQAAEKERATAETARNLALVEHQAAKRLLEAAGRRRGVKKMLRMVEELEVQIEQLEDKADHLGAEADRMRSEADVMRAKAEHMDPKEAKRLQLQALELETGANEMEHKILMIRRETETLERRVDDLEAKADAEEDRLEAEEEE